MTNSNIKSLMFLAYLLAVFVQSSHGQKLIHTFNDPSPSTESSFGRAVAIDGDEVLISDPNNQAYLFDAVSGELIRTIKNPERRTSRSFGTNISMKDGLALISNGGTSTPGAAHLFNTETGELLHTFVDPEHIDRDRFGGGEVLLLDGDFALIGEASENGDLDSSGRIHVFDVNTGDHLRWIDDPTPTDYDRFRAFGAVAGRVLVGAERDDTIGEDAGEAYLIDIATGGILLEFEDPSADAHDWFGTNGAFDGERVLIGELNMPADDEFPGEVHLYDAESGDLLHTFLDPTPAPGDYFGAFVEMNSYFALVADLRLAPATGEAHLFDLSNGEHLATFTSPTPDTLDFFALEMAIEGDRVLIGAWGSGLQGKNAAYLYDISEFLPSTLGDCNEDDSLDVHDLACVADIAERDAVLAALHSPLGDLDGNGAVDFADFLVLSSNFGKSGLGYTDGNIDLVDDVAFSDFLTLSDNFGKSFEQAASLVPEPTDWSLLVCLGTLIGFRRTRIRPNPSVRN